MTAFDWKTLAHNFGRIIDRIQDERCDQYNNGWLAGYRGKPCTDNPDFIVGWKEGQRERRHPVVAVMPARPEGYYHAPIGTFD